MADHADWDSGFPLNARGNDSTVVEPRPDRHQPRFDDTYCWVCGAAIVEVHCKIVCKHCGFTRDCSDP